MQREYYIAERLGISPGEKLPALKFMWFCEMLQKEDIAKANLRRANGK